MSDNTTPSQIQPVNLGQEPTDFAEQSGDKSSVANPEIVPTSPRQVDVSGPRINSSLAARDDDASAAISPGANGWVPIETAPKDWSDILLFDPEYESDWRQVFEGYYSCEDGGRGCWVDAGNERVNPTHWQPLPKPPVSEASK